MPGFDPSDPSLTRREFVTGAVGSGAALLLTAADEKPATPSFAAGSDWPMYRHDPELSAESPLRGGLAQPPRVSWSLELGGPKIPSESVVVRDVTGDGLDEFLTLSVDSIVCRDSRGRLLWKLDEVLNPSIIDILDFAGDGSRGILFTTTRAGRIDTQLVDGRSGKAVHLWFNENNFGGHLRIGKLLPDVAGVQIAATSSGQTLPAPHGGDVHLVSFEHGLERPNFRVREHVTGVFYSPLILFADLDGNGKDELVVVSHEQIWAFDAAGGGQTFYAAYSSSIRTYMATVAAIRLAPDDAWPALIMSPAGTSLVCDFGNNGRFVIMVSIKNERGDGASRLAIFDAQTGKRLAEHPDAQVLAVDDLDGDGKQELLLLRGAELSARNGRPAWSNFTGAPSGSSKPQYPV